mgnify:CR=1 FL=1
MKQIKPATLFSPRDENADSRGLLVRIVRIDRVVLQFSIQCRAADPEPAAAPEPEVPAESDLRVGPTSTSLTADELATQSGVTVEIVEDLESFGMIESRRVGAESYFEPSARVVVDACRSFLDHGIEVRHLRMYKIAAEREAGVFEQLVMPLLKQRNPEARSRAADTVAELAEVGETLHAALLRKALSESMP